MTTVVIGCDHNTGQDTEYQDKMAEVLEGGGYETEKLSVGPNSFASYSYNQNGKQANGKIGVFILAVGLTSICDLYDGNTNFDYAYFAVRGGLGQGMDTQEEFQSKGVHKDKHGDCISKSCNILDGKTYPEINEYISSKGKAVFGTSPEELANNVLDAIKGGSGNTGEGGDDSSSSDDKEPTPMSYVDMIKDLISVWDGDVECKVRQDKLYINKVPKPNPELWIVEGNNIVSGNAKTSDYHSDTINTLHVTYNNKTITITDEYLINRFGVVEETIPAVEIVTDYSGDSTDGTTDGTDGGTSDDSNQYRTIAGILQKYMTSNDWNSYINSVRKCTTRDQVKNLIVGHKKRDGVKARNNLIITEICEALKIET